MLTANERKYLLDSMHALFDQYQYQYTDTALNEIIDEWYAQKGTLIEAFKKHPNYIPGKFMIAFSHTYERGITKKESSNFGCWIRNEAMHETRGYLPQPIKDRTRCFDLIPDNIYDFFYYLRDYAEATISEATANHLAEIIPEVPVRPGQKTTKVINKICTYLGFNHAQDYNKEFAKYADSLSPMKIKRHTILSVNPLDYLTMSFGNSWASCHTIDTKNARNMPNAYHGQYSSGTVSYSSTLPAWYSIPLTPTTMEMNTGMSPRSTARCSITAKISLCRVDSIPSAMTVKAMTFTHPIVISFRKSCPSSSSSPTCGL